MRAALIGCGYWGKILIPYIKEKFNLVSITGRKDSDIKKIAKDIDVFFIATPIETHYHIVKKCIKQGKHVFCEKPLATSYKKALKLYNLSKKYNVKLYTDYTEMTAPSRLEMVKMVDRVGKIFEINGFTRQHGRFTDQHVFWQLSCHQLSMLSLFVDLKELKFINVKLDKNKITRTGLIKYFGKIFGSLYVSIDSGYKDKLFVIKGTRGKLIYDYNNQYPVKVYQMGVLKIRKKFDEKNNLFFSINNFVKIINGEIESNNLISIKIVKIIENLFK